MKTSETPIPLVIQVNTKDNVAIVVSSEGVSQGLSINSVRIKELIPQCHKVALTDFAAGDPIIRYGEVIGYAKESIIAGSWVKEDNMELPEAPDLTAIPMADHVAQSLPPLEGYTFNGYRNNDGSVGTKNLLGIATSVQCVEGVLKIAVERIKNELLPKYPHVDGVVPINHNYGCGVAIDAPEAVIPIRTLRNLALHPNFGGELLVISLGCEKLPPEKLLPGMHAGNIVVLQNEIGFQPMIERIMQKAEEILERLEKRRREVCPVSDLVIGLQCGGSDAFSGITANPAIGYAADLLVRAGATVLFSEVTEVRDGVHLLAQRVANPVIGEKLKQEMAWYDRYLKLGGVGREANTAPGNKKGGLSNIVEKAMGSITKSGSSAIVDVLSPGERAEKKGLIYAATPASDFVCGTCQLASGITLQVFSTGRGTPYGLAIAPVIKVSTRSGLADKWKDLIDVDAGRILSGEVTIKDVGMEIFKMILDVASGTKKVWADQWGVENALCLFNPAPVT